MSTITLTYGELPDREEFLARADKEQYPYSMQLVAGDAEVAVQAVNHGIDAHLEIVGCSWHGETNKLGFHKLHLSITDPESMYTFLRRVVEDSEDLDQDPSPGMDLVSCILQTLDYEWV